MHHVVEKCSLWQEWTWSSVAHLLGPRLHSGQLIAHPATGFSPSFRSAHCSPSRATGFCLHSGQLIAHPAGPLGFAFIQVSSLLTQLLCPRLHSVQLIAHPATGPSHSFRSAHCLLRHWVLDSKTLIQWAWSGSRNSLYIALLLGVLGIVMCVGEPAAVKPVDGGVVDRADRRDQNPRLHYLLHKLSGTDFTI